MEAYEQGGSAIFYKVEEDLESADTIDVEFNAWILRYSQPGWAPSANLGVAVSDGDKVALIWPGGDPTQGRVFFTTGEDSSGPGATDWFSANTYKIVFNQEVGKANFYVNGIILGSLLDEELDDAELFGLDEPRIVAFGSVGADTVWDYLEYSYSGYDKDWDGDGYIDEACEGGTDCDDTDASVHPAAKEICDLKDNDCDGFTDENLERHVDCVATGVQGHRKRPGQEGGQRL